MNGTVTEAGTEATDGVELESRTNAPPGGAAEVKFTTLPPRENPLTAVAEDRTTELTAAVRIVSVALAIVPLTPLNAAEMVTVVAEAIGVVVMLKGADVVAPAATVTEDGTEPMAGFDELRLNTNPPAGAGVTKVKVLGVTLVPP